MFKKRIKVEGGGTSGICFLLPSICTDLEETEPNICLVFLGWQVTFSLEKYDKTNLG